MAMPAVRSSGHCLRLHPLGGLSCHKATISSAPHQQLTLKLSAFPLKEIVAA